MTDFELVRRLQEVVAKEAGLKNVRELLAHNREWRNAKFRDSAIYIARTKTDLALEKLGELFGARHHTTLACAIRREKARLQRKPPRHDKRTWVEWHDYLYKKAMEGAEAPTVPTTPPVLPSPSPETPTSALPEAEKGTPDA